MYNAYFHGAIIKISLLIIPSLALSLVHPSCKRSRKFRVGWVDGNTFYIKRMHYFPKISSKGFGLVK